MYDLLKLNQEDLNKYAHNKKCHSDSLKKKGNNLPTMKISGLERFTR